MSEKIFFSVQVVQTQNQLPEKLKLGRAYFVADDQIIIVDHGYGPVVYGGKTGPQGAPGESSPLVQEQLDDLAAASLRTSKIIWDMAKESKADFDDVKDSIISVQTQSAESLEQLRTESQESLEQLRTESQESLNETAGNLSQLRHDFDAAEAHRDIESDARFSFVEELTANNANAIQSLITTVNRKFNDYEASIAILTKAITELYPAHISDNPEEFNDPLDNETISTDAGTWTIQQTTLSDGTIVLNLTAQELVIDTLKAGDSVSFDGTSWKVEEITNSDGTISITLKP